MMKTEEPSFSLSNNEFNTYNAAEVAEAKKVKLMYTSEFLKSFDRTPKPNTLLSLEDLEFDNKKTPRTGEKLRERETQLMELSQIIFKLKEIVMEHKDEPLIAKMKEILNETIEGQQFLGTSNGHKIPALRFNDDVLASPPAAPSPSGPPPGLSVQTPNRATRDSPATTPTSSVIPPLNFGSNTPTTSTSASSTASPSTLTVPGTAPSMGMVKSESAKQVSLRSPRRAAAPAASTGMTKSASQTWTTSQTSSSGPMPTSAQGGSNANQRNLMKRSPSMPAIANDKKPAAAARAGAQEQQEGPARIGNSKKTKSFNENPDKRRDNQSPAKVPESPRKGIKKSVSMSAICMDNDEKAAAALKCTSLEEIVGQIYPLTKYQAGCRFLQKKLEEQPDPVHVTLVFNEVFEHLIELMTDPYGQYLVPKLMKHCDKTQRQAIVTKIAPKIVTFACHTYGIHGVQKILEYLTDDQVKAFVDVIKPAVIHLAKDGKGNYLIQSFLKQFQPERNQFIYDAIVSHCVDVATHKVGCTLINRCIDHSSEQQMNAFVRQLSANCLVLVQDQFGNYVIQHILNTKPTFAPAIIRAMLGHIPELSVQKFSSNVIEKCLQVAVTVEPELFSSIIREIADANLLELLQDRYANFVIQTALDEADDVQHAKLVKLILPYIHQIKTPYVMHIQKKILQV